MDKLANNIRFLRLRDGYTLDEVAKKLGLKSKTNINAYETGVCYPKADTLVALSNLFKCSIDSMMKQDLAKGEVSWEESFKADIEKRLKRIERKLIIQIK